MEKLGLEQEYPISVKMPTKTRKVKVKLIKKDEREFEAEIEGLQKENLRLMKELSTQIKTERARIFPLKEQIERLEKENFRLLDVNHTLWKNIDKYVNCISGLENEIFNFEDAIEKYKKESAVYFGDKLG